MPESFIGQPLFPREYRLADLKIITYGERDYIKSKKVIKYKEASK